MTRKEQKQFVRELVASVTSQVYAAIDAGKVPEWNGFELRQYLADKFGESTVKMDRQRQREYDNHVTVTAGL